MNQASMNERIEEIAQQILYIDVLRRQGGDSLDFHDLHVDRIREALEEAYRAGAQSK